METRSITSGRLGIKVWRATVRYGRDLSGCVSRQEVQQDSITRFGCHIDGFFLSPLSISIAHWPSSPSIGGFGRIRRDSSATYHKYSKDNII